MTSSEFRQLLYSLNAAERKVLAERLDVSVRTVQRWSTYANEQRDALRSNPDLRNLSESEVRIGIQGAAASLSQPPNKGSGEISEEYTFRTWADACRFAQKVKEGKTDNTFLNNSVTGIQIVNFGGYYAVLMSYDVAYSESEGWADREWDDGYESDYDMEDMDWE